MDQWVKDYQTKCSGTTITYNGTGSGAGVSNFIAKQDDFAGSDSALDPTQGRGRQGHRRLRLAGAGPADGHRPDRHRLQAQRRRPT